MPPSRLLYQALLWYGARLPYHRGKAAVAGALDRRLGFSRFYGGKTFQVRRGGIEWELSPDCLVQWSVFFTSTYEARETRVVRKMVRPDWVFLDVGAYFGYYSLLVSRASGGAATVHAFEPFSPHCELVRRNARLNGFANLHVHQAAVAERPGTLAFRPALAGNQGCGHLAAGGPDGRGAGALETVRSTSLDAFVEEHRVPKLDFVKLDIEGAEARALAGARDTLRRHRPAMMLEVNPGALEEMGSSVDEVGSLLGELGYRTFRAGWNGLEPFAELGQVREYCNLFCLPR